MNGIHDEDPIVISGIAGRYPDCDSFNEFKEALLAGIDLVNEDDRRWKPGIFNTPKPFGKLNNIEYFDAGYFGISPRQVDVMDPKHRVMLETAYEAIVDSGYNPKEIKGSPKGVYVGIGAFDNSQAYKELEKTNGYALIGSCLCQIANRTSFTFDLKGPSFVIDTACSSGIYAFANAVEAMEKGEIDGALVSAVNIILHPFETTEFTALNMLAADGKCKVFATDRDGFGRSEAIITVFLQRRSACRRMYSTVLGAAMNCDGWKVEGITFPSSKAQLELMQSLYEKRHLNPYDVTYVEMHGTGTPSGDISECKSVVEFFCQNRKTPLPVGAVKSNMGHSEISSGLCSLSKVLVAMETGIIPKNLHCEKIDYTLPGISDGKLKVVTSNLPWNGGMVSLNCFGFGGANAHLVIKSNDIPKKRFNNRSHRLVAVSGRTEESVRYFLDKVQEHKNDEEFLALVDEIHKIDVEGHPYRGYMVLNSNPTSQIKRTNRKKRPIWFIYSGMGSQWTGMSKDFMKFEIYRNTIKKCAEVLKPYNIDLEHIITTDDPTVFDNITNCFCAITAAEIALTDVLRAFGIEPDGFAGHSLGEVGCAYCNGDLTAEQAILLGFARGYGMAQTNCTRGQMAAVGLNKEHLSKYLPQHVYIACVNSTTSCTITGLQKPVELFVEALSKKGVFTRLVQSAGYAFHSEYIHPAAPHLENFASKVILDPKPRSPKWISSSVKESEWNSPDAQLNSAKYHSNNFKCPVLFDQVLKRIPKDAIVVEIAPHGLLTSILKKELGPEVTCLSLANRSSKDNVQFLLSNIGLLYINGSQPDLRSFYPGVSFPVGRGTPNIGSLVKWDHSVKWFTPFYEENKTYGKKMTVNTDSDNYKYIKGHNIDGRVLMPATGYLELAWKVLAHMTAKPLEHLPVTFHSIKFIRATILPEGEDVIFNVNIMKQSGYFEIFEGGSVCCSGTILEPKNISEEFLNIDVPMRVTNGLKPLLKQDIYKWFHLRRYMYSGTFQGMEAVDVTGTLGKLKWNGCFTSFLDTMIQVPLVSKYSGDLLLPTRLQKVVINPMQHLKEVEKNKELAVYHDKYLKVTKSGGIEIINLEVLEAPKRQKIQSDPVLQSQVFVPYINKNSTTSSDIQHGLTVALQIIFENNGLARNLNVLEISQKENSLVKLVNDITRLEPIASVTFVDDTCKRVDVVLSPDGHLEKESVDLLIEEGFIVFCGLEKNFVQFGLSVVYENSLQAKGVYLLRKITTNKTHATIEITNANFNWLAHLQSAIKQKDLLFVKNHNSDLLSGVVGLVKCLNLEPTEKALIKCIFLKDTEVKDEDEQIYKRLTINVFENGVWGSYRHLLAQGLKQIEVSDACNYVQTVGDLSSLIWVERPQIMSRPEFGLHKVFVHYAALNFKDVMLSTGKIAPNEKSITDPDVPVGFEYSGISETGKRLMGLAANSIGLQLLPDPLFSWEVPKKWTLEEAATVPVVYATCYYGMILRGQLQEGESILIHAGAGGIGIAAISISFSMGCEIFTTVGSKEKKEFLLHLFPNLKAENIGNSRNASFEQMILRNTKGKGVDMVLNSLSAELFQASIRCVAQRGRFVEIGKVDLWAGTPVSASLFSKNTSFHGVLLDDLFDLTEKSFMKKEINRWLSEGISNGVVNPLPRTVFNEDQIEDAYRFLSTGKHKGKVLIKIRTESSTIKLQKTIKALPRIHFNPNKTYILIGGLGGIGLELTDFLIRRCAKKIILNSRRGVVNGYQQLCLKKWAELKEGISVKVNVEDTSKIEGARKLVEIAEEMGPIGGVFNLALVLEDALFINQTPEKFKSVFKSKVYSGLNMDEITRAHCPELDHFVVFSSITSGRGNPGQSNYGMANSALERLCEKRRADGFPGLAVQFGAVGDVGAVAENHKFDKIVNLFGMDTQTISSCLSALETFMLQPHPVGSSFVLKETTTTTNRTSDKSPVETVAHILGIKNISLIDSNQHLGDMGLDSLMSAEIKQTLYRNFQIELSIEDIRELSLTKIASMATKKCATERPAINGVNGHQRNITFNAMLSNNTIVEIINDKSSDKKVFFVPPIEGTVEAMLPLAKKIKSNVYGLQFTKVVHASSITEYAMNFIKTIKQVQNKGPYVLCGYSYGGLLGFEISAQLEKMNEKVVLYMIDGAPSFVKKILEEKFNQFGKIENESKKAVLRAFIETFDEVNDVEKINQIFSNLTSLEDLLLKVGDLVAENTTYNAEDVVESAKRYVERIAAAFYYNPVDKVKCDVTLLRSDNILKDMPEDYDLQRICDKPVHLHKLKGNHKQIILGPNLQRIADMINTVL